MATRSRAQMVAHKETDDPCAIDQSSSVSEPAKTSPIPVTVRATFPPKKDTTKTVRRSTPQHLKIKEKHKRKIKNRFQKSNRGRVPRTQMQPLFQKSPK